MRKITTIVISAFSAILSVPSHAQYYGGLPLSAMRASIPADAGNLLFRSRLFGTAETLENGGTDMRVGYRFSNHLVPHLALVGQYANASRWDAKTLAFDGTQAAPRTSSYGLDLVGTLPIFSRLSLSGSAGVARVRADSVFGGGIPIGLLGSDGRSTSAGRLGLGVQYDFNRSLGFRFGVERYRNLNGSAFIGNTLDADTFSFGMRVRF